MNADALEAAAVHASGDDDDQPVHGVQGRLFDVAPIERAGEESSGAPTGAEPPARSDVSTTAEQEQAIARRGEPLLLAAGAGSGKTTVLVERFIRAVLEDEIPPAAILAITFTERAAGELRERVRERLVALGARAAARDTEAAFVGTFHGFCARLLRTHPLLAPLPVDFSILDEGLAGALEERAFVESARELQQSREGEAVDLLAAYGVDQVRAMIRGVHAELRSRGQSEPSLPVAVARPDAPDPAAEQAAVEACRVLDELLGLFARAYARMKRERSSADFDDLELGALALLRDSEPLRRSWSERFRLLMVDEFQDTNPRQLAILEALDRDNLFTVGDEMQSIYGFRHARVELFRERRALLAPLGASLALTANFRSAAALLEVINHAFAARVGLGTAGFVPLQAGDRGDAATGGDADEAAVELLLTDRNGWEEQGSSELLAEGLPPASLWRLAEARLLATRVRELVDSARVRAGDVVVLLRATGDIDVYERALQHAGLRTLAFVGGYWRRLEVRDLLARLRAIANPLDEDALYETLAAPPLSLSTDGMAILGRAARRRGRSVWLVAREAGDGEAPLDSDERGRIDAFCAQLAADRREAQALGIPGLIERALAAGYREHVLAQPDAARRLANVHKLQRLARRFEQSDGNDLRAFLDHAERLAAEGSREPDAPVESVDPDAVRLMSIHAAKGLEFPVVCVADLGRGANTRVPRLLVDGSRLGLQLVRLGGGAAQPSLDYRELCQERSLAQAEEEDRILYVAMTRARELLILSGAVDLERWPDPADRTPIGWLSCLLAGEEGRLPRQSGTWELSVGSGEDAPRVRWTVNRADGAERLLAARAGDSSGSEEARAGCGARSSSGEPAAEFAVAGRPDHGAEPLAGLEAVSYTALARLERCGYRFYLERVLGMPQAAEDRAGARGLAADTRGTIVHGLMERVDFGRPRVPSTEQVKLAARRLGADLAPAEREELAGLIGAALSAPMARRIAAGSALRREHPFAFAIGAEQPLVTGVIDLMAREGDGTALVVDYKSDRLESGGEIAPRADADYGLQRLIYGVAALREGATAVEVVHWFLARPREPATIRFEDAELTGLEAELADRIAVAARRGFAVSARPHRALCQTCPGRGGLCSWSEREQLRERPEPD